MQLWGTLNVASSNMLKVKNTAMTIMMIMMVIQHSCFILVLVDYCSFKKVNIMNKYEVQNINKHYVGSS
jgi:hypothetical protein